MSNRQAEVRDAHGLPVLVSADSHVVEPTELWEDVLPPGYWGNTNANASQIIQQAGGYDPKARIEEMTTDTVSAEVLYPTLALRLFGLEDAAVQEECFRRYNDWLAEYCSVDTERLVGVGLVAAWDINHAVEEASRCHDLGLRGIEVWQSPHPDLPFWGRHYDPLWEACSNLGLPVSLHILTGNDYSQAIFRQAQDGAGQLTVDLYRLPITAKLAAAMDALLDMVFSGALDRFPALHLVLVENEVAWLPFFIDQCDYYYQRFSSLEGAITLDRLPSEVFRQQVSATFFRDPNAQFVVEQWGVENVMWSNDYPHGNSTWPRSREVVNDRLGSLDPATFDRVVAHNACALYGLDLERISSPA